ncbi:MAG: hypothetical protein SFV15_22895 [Polyangiaceae bacterium]|nr:hypothetical protein [Polyangiaceae bacterium]
MRRHSTGVLLATLQWGLALVAMVALAGCGGSLEPAASPDGGSAARCRVGASQTSVLVTEWSAPEKANLESLMHGSAVAVEFTGCELRLLPECRLKGRYQWRRTTPSSDLVEIRNEAELFAKLPLGALSLAGELQRSGGLFIETTISGQLRLEEMTTSEVTAAPECARATHIIDGLALGAFAMTVADSGRTSANAGWQGVGVGGEQRTNQRLVRSAGHKEACREASDGVAPVDCGSPLQIYLSPIFGRAEAPGPPGTVKTDFVSSSGSVRWDVFVEDQATCTTPCSRYVDPNHPLELRTHSGAPTTLTIDRLPADKGPLQVTAKPTSFGKLATGITFTALGGMATLTGVTLSSVGCGSDRHQGLCTAGLITLPIGAIVGTGAIWLMLDAGAEAQVVPLFSGNSGGMLLKY